MEKSTAVFDKEKAQERLSKLSGGVAVFKVCYYGCFHVFCILSKLCALTYHSTYNHRLEEPVSQRLGKGRTG